MATSNVTTPPPQGKSFLEKILSLFSVVKSGEGGSAILLTLNVFLLLGAYYFLKIVRDTLILDESGAAAASYSAAGQALLLLLVVPAYGYLAAKVNRIRLVSWATLFFVSHLVIFFLLGSAGYRIGIPFYLWLGIFNIFVVAQFWAFANDIYSEEQGDRLFPIIAVGASLGAWVGSSVIEQTFESLGAYLPMMIGAGLLIVCVLITQWVNRRETLRGGAAEAEKAEQPLGKEGGFQLVMSSRYLMSIAILILLLNVVNSTGGYLLNSLVEAASDAQVAAGAIAIGAERQAFIG
jgi:AAA family ATP:ADP antiporter